MSLFCFLAFLLLLLRLLLLRRNGVAFILKCKWTLSFQVLFWTRLSTGCICTVWSYLHLRLSVNFLSMHGVLILKPFRQVRFSMQEIYAILATSLWTDHEYTKIKKCLYKYLISTNGTSGLVFRYMTLKQLPVQKGRNVIFESHK